MCPDDFTGGKIFPPVFIFYAQNAAIAFSVFSYSGISFSYFRTVLYLRTVTSSPDTEF